jgi:chromosomal replication initiation ATPase DnaA
MRHRPADAGRNLKEVRHGRHAPGPAQPAPAVWDAVLDRVKSQLASPQAFETWFRPIEALELTPARVELEVPNVFFADWIHEHYLTVLRQALADELGQCPELRFSPREPVAAPLSARARRRAPCRDRHHDSRGDAHGAGARVARQPAASAG